MFVTIQSLLSTIKEKKPLILNITNDVTMDFIANGLLSMGASPIMSQAEQEMADLIQLADAVVINPGTLDERFVRLSHVAAKMANQLDKPIIFDPVGAGASRYRRETCMQLVKQYKIAIIRGNSSEILALSDQKIVSKGVDTTTDSLAVITSARDIARDFSTTILMSGVTDVVLEGDRVQTSQRGSAWMPQLTGSGCLLSAVVAAFHAVEKDSFRAAMAAAIFYGVCGEMAAVQTKGPGTFKVKFLDALHALPEKHWYDTK